MCTFYAKPELSAHVVLRNSTTPAVEPSVRRLLIMEIKLEFHLLQITLGYTLLTTLHSTLTTHFTMIYGAP